MTVTAQRVVPHRPVVTTRAWWAVGTRPELLVFVVALVARLGVIFRAHGLHGFYGYDAAVYFAAGDALAHGRMPYRDFVLLHPPGLMLVLTPFAELGRWMSDADAFAIASLAFCAIGAAAAVLVVRVSRALGFGTRAAVVGGLFYALWYGAVDAEYLTKLEPLSSLLFLGGVLLSVRAQARGGTARALLAGALLGAAVSVKIWWIVPVLGVLLWHVIARRGRGSRYWPVLGALVAAVAINLPFFLAAPRAMWNAVIVDQVGRAQTRKPFLVRLVDLTSATHLHGYAPTAVVAVLALLFVVAAVPAAALAVTVPRARPVVALLAAQVIVLLASPSWFSFYVDYAAGTMSITMAAAAASRRYRRTPGAALRWAPVAVSGVITLTALGIGAGVVHPFHGATTLSRAVRTLPCVMSDSPMGLIGVDALSRDLAHGCPNWVDVTGRTYAPPDEALHGESRVHTVQWQRDLITYLRSGQAVIIVRRSGTGISAATLRAITRDGVLVRAGGYTVYRVEHPG